MISLDIAMETAVECTHCQVTMTSWSAPGSRVRYFQCPFCQRTHSSLYDEVFDRGAGVRRIEARVRSPSAALPMATREQIEWAGVKARAARWFARLEAEEHQASARLGRAVVAAQPAPRLSPALLARPASAGARASAPTAAPAVVAPRPARTR